MTRITRNPQTTPPVTMRSIIQRIATGPDLSKDLPEDEARAGMQMILNQDVPPVQAGIFLIALRMKRETDDENRGVLQALIDSADIATATVDDVVDLADPYDGYTRSLLTSPLLPLLLAEMGVACVTHGAESMGPKYGVTHRQVLRAAGLATELSPAQAADRIANPDIGWAYVDQNQFCKPLSDLHGLRDDMVKRSVLTTVEVLVGPVRGRRNTHLVTGYVHKPYPRIYALLARHAGFNSALLVRGVEGGIIPSLRQPAKLFSYHDTGEEAALDIHPSELGIKQADRAVKIPDDLPPAAPRASADEITSSLNTEAVAMAAVAAGRAALGGERNPTYDSLLYGAVNILDHLKRYPDRSAAATAVRAVLNSGAALRRLETSR